jgi:DNA sulfur modification protein DndB
MKIPSLKARIGDWDYYVTTLTFSQVSQYVSKIDENLYRSEGLKDLIQRSITNNYLKIKEYILNQPEFFFNALVLAVYDDYPTWREIEFTYDDLETYQMGLLEFPGNHKIFPVDGQHRVEGIKAALLQNPALGDQRIAAIFIGHKNDEIGKQKTRRLFTTLNRYAKPVKDDDIIALDEDDIVAIVTRNLLEDYDLFSNKRIVNAKQKAIPQNNKEAITSIITLYQANIEILKKYHEIRHGKKLTNNSLKDFLKFRRSESEIAHFQEYLIDYWDSFKTELACVSTFLRNDVAPAAVFRNNITGGNLIFRPIGFLPLVKASLIIQKRSRLSFTDIFERFNSINLDLNNRPWISVAWNQIEHKMIMNSDSLIQMLLIFLFDESLLLEEEFVKLKKGYASKISFEGENIENILDGIK